MNVKRSKLNSLGWHSRWLVQSAVLLFILVATVGLLGLCSCATSSKGLAREQAIVNTASNTIAVLQPVVQAAPAPINSILGTVFAGLSGLLAVWATHIHRSVSELKKTNGNGNGNGAGPPPA